LTNAAITRNIGCMTRWPMSPDRPPAISGLAGDARATRLDPASGVTEEASFLPVGDERMFVFDHLPRGETRASVVVCSPIHAAFLHNYRKEVILARSLAASGVAVTRFHYRGSGSSDGNAEDLGFSSMLFDCMTAFEAIRRKKRVEKVVFLGTQLGAIVAAAAARETGTSPIVAWEPVVDPHRHFREMVRAAAVRELRHQVRGASTSHHAPSIESLTTTGVVDVLGFSLHAGLYRSFLPHRFPDGLGDKARDVLLLQIEQNHSLNDEYSRAVRSLRSKGFRVEAQAIRGDDHWWLSGDPRHAAATLKRVVRATADWFEGILA
jgi:hypothetical protein